MADRPAQHCSTPDEIHAELVRLLRVPLADMVRIIIEGECHPDAIEAATKATADGIAGIYYQGIANALDTGKAIERFMQSVTKGLQQ